jgi:predicted RNA-binding protein
MEEYHAKKIHKNLVNMVSYWLFVTNKFNLDIILDNELYGFNKRNIKFYENIKEGDFIILYLTPKRIVGFLKILKKKLDSQIEFKDGTFPFQIKLSKINILEKPYILSNELIERISVFKNKKHWGGVLMGKPGVKITKEDYNLLFEETVIKN